MKTPEELEKKLLNFAHHYEFEESGLKLRDIKNLILEKELCMITLWTKKATNGLENRF